jgi:hypothetical protein
MISYIEKPHNNINLFCLTSSKPELSGCIESCESHLLKFCKGKGDLQDNAFIWLVSRIAKKMGIIVNTKSSSAKAAYLSLLMGVGSRCRLFPICYSSEIIPYCYDCWPNSWKTWQSFFSNNNVKVAFFSSKQACEHFAISNPQIICHWLPEATDPNNYVCSKLLQDREIDVLEMGRKYLTYHDSISTLLYNKYIHLYEKTPGRIIFPTTELLVNGLANSKISICFPASMTHPKKASGLETVTHRYFESMASKCLIIGYCPDELLSLFGYNPVIEADLENPYYQIIEILNNISKYQELVDKNYLRLLEVGTWEVRVKTIIDLLVNTNKYTL